MAQLMSAWRRIWTISTKELLQLKRDRFILFLIFLMPLATVLIYGFAIRIIIPEVPLLVQDFDQSPLSRAYVEQLAETHRFKLLSSAEIHQQPFLTSPRSSHQLPLKAIDQGLAKAAIIIPPDFAQRIKQEKTSPIQVLMDGTDVNNTRAIRSYVRAVTATFLSKQGLQPSESPGISANVRLWSNLGGREDHFIVPGVYALVLWVYPSMLAAMATAREREQGTLIQIYASNLKGIDLLLGKSLAFFLIGLVQTALVIGVGSWLFDLRLMGDPTPLLVSIPLLLGSSVVFGVLIGNRANTRIVAIQSGTLLGYLTSSFLTGIYHPLRNIPFPLSLISDILPTRYFVDISRDAFVRGAGWSGVWGAILIMLVLGLLIFRSARKSLSRMQLPD